MTRAKYNELKALLTEAGVKFDEVVHHKGDPTKPTHSVVKVIHGFSFSAAFEDESKPADFKRKK